MTDFFATSMLAEIVDGRLRFRIVATIPHSVDLSDITFSTQIIRSGDANLSPEHLAHADIPQHQALPAMRPQTLGAHSSIGFAPQNQDHNPDSIRPNISALPNQGYNPDSIRPDISVLPNQGFNPDSIRPNISALPNQGFNPDSIRPNISALPNQGHNPDSIRPVISILPNQDYNPDSIRPNVSVFPNQGYNPDSIRPDISVLPNQGHNSDSIRPNISALQNQEGNTEPTAISNNNERRSELRSERLRTHLIQSILAFVQLLPVIPRTQLPEDVTSCSICLEPFTTSREAASQLGCGHIFGGTCIFRWLTAGGITCPVCRANIYSRSHPDPLSALRRASQAIVEASSELIRHGRTQFDPNMISGRRLGPLRGTGRGYIRRNSQSNNSLRTFSMRAHRGHTGEQLLFAHVRVDERFQQAPGFQISTRYNLRPRPVGSQHASQPQQQPQPQHSTYTQHPPQSQHQTYTQHPPQSQHQAYTHHPPQSQHQTYTQHPPQSQQRPPTPYPPQPQQRPPTPHPPQ